MRLTEVEGVGVRLVDRLAAPPGAGDVAQRVESPVVVDDRVDDVRDVVLVREVALVELDTTRLVEEEVLAIGCDDVGTADRRPRVVERASDGAAECAADARDQYHVALEVEIH